MPCHHQLEIQVVECATVAVNDFSNRERPRNTWRACDARDEDIIAGRQSRTSARRPLPSKPLTGRFAFRGGFDSHALSPTRAAARVRFAGRMTQTPPPNPEREQTDESLRSEREQADLALGEEQAAIDETADAVINKARARADAALAEARANTDRHAGRANARASGIVAEERSLEDQAVREERADADESLRIERAEQVALLSAERTETDKDLSSERARSDAALATRDAFLGVVSHDLRNILSGMMGFAGMISRDVARDDHPAIAPAE